jgi:hypothetical protein
VVSELCRPGGNKYVVEVRRHGWLPRNSTYYYLDMEYCSESLEDRIHGVETEGDQLNGSIPVEKVEMKSTSTYSEQQTADTSFSPTSTPNTMTSQAAIRWEEAATDDYDWASILDIMDDITRGLEYVHENGTVHRDLKPRNGTHTQIDDLMNSPLLREGPLLEDCGFRDCLRGYLQTVEHHAIGQGNPRIPSPRSFARGCEVQQ